MPSGPLYKPNDAHLNTIKTGIELGVPLDKIGRRIGLTKKMMYSHYGDVIRSYELKAGVKPFEPTEEQRQIVTMAAAVGQTHESIARLIGIGKGTLQDHFSEELALGIDQANLKVGGNMFKMATGNPESKSTVTAAIWWTKARMGWKDTSRVENTGADGGPIENRHRVMVMLPDNGRGDTSDDVRPPHQQLLPAPEVKVVENGIRGDEEDFTFSEGD